MATKVCPNCGWRKDVTTEVCHCGHDFSSENPISKGSEKEIGQNIQASIPAEHPITAVVENEGRIAGLKYLLIFLSIIVAAELVFVPLSLMGFLEVDSGYAIVMMCTPIGAIVGLSVGSAYWLKNRSRNDELVGLILMLIILLSGWGLLP